MTSTFEIGGGVCASGAEGVVLCSILLFLTGTDVFSSSEVSLALNSDSSPSKYVKKKSKKCNGDTRSNFSL